MRAVIRIRGDADIRQDFPGGWLGDENNAFKEAVLWPKSIF
jgi:hypothetical protein